MEMVSPSRATWVTVIRFSVSVPVLSVASSSACSASAETLPGSVAMPVLMTAPSPAPRVMVTFVDHAFPLGQGGVFRHSVNLLGDRDGFAGECGFVGLKLRGLYQTPTIFN